MLLLNTGGGRNGQVLFYIVRGMTRSSWERLERQGAFWSRRWCQAAVARTLRFVLQCMFFQAESEPRSMVWFVGGSDAVGPVACRKGERGIGL